MWSLRRLAVIVTPLTAATILAADPIATLIHDGEGRTYAAAGLPLKLLAAAAMLRVMSQLLYPLALGSGRPRTAVRLSAATLLLSVAGMLIVGLCFPARAGTIAVSAVWVAVYALLLIWGTRYLRRQWAIRGSDLARALLRPLAVSGVLVSVVGVSRLVIGDVNSWLQVEVVAAALGLTYAGLLLPSWRRVAA